MQFPSAARGVKKIFASEILYLFSAVLLGVATTIAGIVIEEGSMMETALGIVLLVFISAGGVLAILGLIIKIVGVVQTSRDEPSFRGVIFLAIFTLCVFCFAQFFPNDQLISSITRAVSSVVSVISNILIILGICNLARQLDEPEVIEKGGKILRIVLALAVLSIIANFISMFLPRNISDASDPAKAFIIALGIFAVALTITEYVLYLSFLRKAVKILNR